MISNPKYVIQKSGAQFFFNLQARNAEKILTSEMYNSRQACQTGIESCRLNAGNADRYKKSDSSNGMFYFVLKAKNGETIGKSQMYTTLYNRDKGIRAVMEAGPAAEIEDLAYSV